MEYHTNNIFKAFKYHKNSLICECYNNCMWLKLTRAGEQKKVFVPVDSAKDLGKQCKDTGKTLKRHGKNTGKVGGKNTEKIQEKIQENLKI